MADLVLEVDYRTRYVPVFDEFDSNTQTDIVWKLISASDPRIVYAEGSSWYEKSSHKHCTDKAGEQIDNLMAILDSNLKVEIDDRRKS